MDGGGWWAEGIKVKTSLEAAGQIRGNTGLDHDSGVGKRKKKKNEFLNIYI